MNVLIDEIYATGRVEGRTGSHALRSQVSRSDGEFLYRIIRDDPSVTRTLEVGCAFGLSSLHICEALRHRTGAAHTMIDPFQSTDWDSAGVKNLERAGIDFFRLIDSKSEFALPRLLEQKKGAFDFVFIDGWHTFDHTLVDCFYATELLRVGGYLAIDDVSFTSVRRVVELLKRYPCYRQHGAVWQENVTTKTRAKKALARALTWPLSRRRWRTILHPTLYRRAFEDRGMDIVVLRKVDEDRRPWNWHADAF